MRCIQALCCARAFTTAARAPPGKTRVRTDSLAPSGETTTAKRMGEGHGLGCLIPEPGDSGPWNA